MVPRGDPAASRDAGARGVQRDVASGIALGAVVIIFLFVCVMQCARSWWREERRRRAREAHENNPWTRMEAARGHHHPDEGSGKPESSAGGSVVRGFMYGLYVINPTGSFSFGSVGVETNEREVRARREATAAAAAAAEAAAAREQEDEDEDDEEGRGRRAAGGEDAPRSSVGGSSEDHLDRRDSPRRIVRSPSGSLRGGGRLGALSGSGSNATLSRLSGRSGGSPATSPDPSARSLSPSRDDAPSSAAATSASAPSPSLNPWAADDDALGGGARREARPPRVGPGGDPGTRGGALEALEAARRDAEGESRTTAADDA